MVPIRDHERLIVALDTSDINEVKRLVLMLKSHVGMFKVGLELMMARGGPQAAEYLRSLDVRVFYDGKFCDVPHAVEPAVRTVAGIGVDFFTVHVAAGRASLEAAARAKGKSRMLGVASLTSIDYRESMESMRDSPAGVIARAAQLLSDVGADGIVCSPLELSQLTPFPKLCRVATGVRPSWHWLADDDQKRFTTPFQAVVGGADYLVVGRPLTNPPRSVASPVRAAELIAEEIGHAREHRP
ncbi:MAG: orotidine-5'-phosphate decarboxylase [Parcubacteria group bacterium]|nr:orotidine-5'-phosphate decarboxylase [Parcubacteria group bacterium]